MAESERKFEPMGPVRNGEEELWPLIDQDPHAKRVISYMRPSDLATWAGFTAGFPAALWGLEKADYSGSTRSATRIAYRVGGILGFATGFLIAYQRSSHRFWGWRENMREQVKDMEDLSDRARKGKPIYGASVESAWIQGIAFRNSHYSQLHFGAIPWFNLINHPHHGVDTAKYYIHAGVDVPKEVAEMSEMRALALETTTAHIRALTQAAIEAKRKGKD